MSEELASRLTQVERRQLLGQFQGHFTLLQQGFDYWHNESVVISVVRPQGLLDDLVGPVDEETGLLDGALLPGLDLQRDWSLL